VPLRPYTSIHTLRQRIQRRSRIPARFQGAARVRQRHYARLVHGEPVVWLTHIRTQLMRRENAPTIRYVAEIMGPIPTCPQIILHWSEEWSRYFRQYARSVWDEAVRQDEFRWHEATQHLDFIYHSRHSYPRWEEVYEAKLVPIIHRLYPSIPISPPMWCPFELSERERDIIQAHLDREIDTPDLDQPEGRARTPSQSSTEDDYDRHVADF